MAEAAKKSADEKTTPPKADAKVDYLPVRRKEVTIELGTPVQANGEMVNKLTFRRPTGGDIMALGDDYPIHIDWATGMIRPNPPAMGHMMSVLAAVPPSTIKALDAEDWSTCAHALMGFFPPGSQAMQS